MLRKTYFSAVLALVPGLAWGHTPIAAMGVLQGILIIPLIISVALAKRGVRLKAAAICIVLYLIINYLITAEIHAALFWGSVALPYLIMFIILFGFLKSKRGKGA